MSTFGGQATSIAQNIQGVASSELIAALDYVSFIENQFRARLSERKTLTSMAFDEGAPPMPKSVAMPPFDPNDLGNALTNVIAGTSGSLAALDAQLATSKDQLLAQFAIIDEQITGQLALQLSAAGLTDNPVASSRQVSGAEAVHTAMLNRLRIKRLDEEAALFSRASSSGFYRAPGSTIAAVMAVREKFTDDVGKSVIETVLDQKKKNALLYTEWAVQSFEFVGGIATQYAKLSSISLDLLLALLPKYDKTGVLADREMWERRQGLVMDFNDRVAKFYRSLEQFRSKWRALEQDQLFETEAMRVKRLLMAHESELGATLPDLVNTVGAINQITSSIGGIASRTVSAFNISASITERGFT